MKNFTLIFLTMLASTTSVNVFAPNATKRAQKRERKRDRDPIVHFLKQACGQKGCTLMTIQKKHPENDERLEQRNPEEKMSPEDMACRALFYTAAENIRKHTRLLRYAHASFTNLFRR